MNLDMIYRWLKHSIMFFLAFVPLALLGMIVGFLVIAITTAIVAIIVFLSEDRYTLNWRGSEEDIFETMLREGSVIRAKEVQGADLRKVNLVGSDLRKFTLKDANTTLPTLEEDK